MPRPLPAAAGQRWRAATPPQQLRPDAALGRRAPPWSCLAADGQHRQVAPPPGRSGLRTTQQAGGRTPTIPPKIGHPFLRGTLPSLIRLGRVFS